MRFEVHYMRPAFFRDGSMGADWLIERGLMPTEETLGDTHVLVRTLDLEGGPRQLERVFHDMQGEVWSPNGEARPLIRSLGLAHTSMSVGDVVVIPEAQEAWIVDRFGFRYLGDDGLPDGAPDAP